MTPLLAALSSSREARCSAVAAASRSPASAAARKCRIDVFSADFTLLLRCRAISLVRMRLIWDLMFATNSLDVPSASGQPCQATSDARTAPNPAADGSALADAHELEPRVQVGADAVRLAGDIGHRDVGALVVAPDHRRPGIVEVDAAVDRREVGELDDHVAAAERVHQIADLGAAR